MMTEISLNVLDVAQNSIRAGADRIVISVKVNTNQDRLVIVISDNGCGMTPDQLKNAEDPFFTTRTTRTIGLGIPFFKYAAESTGGEFMISSEPGRGTTVTAAFVLSHVDRMPLGDMTSTIYLMIISNSSIDFLYTYEIDEKGFSLDTRELRKILDGIPFNAPEVSAYLREYLQEKKSEVDIGRYI